MILDYPVITFIITVRMPILLAKESGVFQEDTSELFFSRSFVQLLEKVRKGRIAISWHAWASQFFNYN